MMNLKLFAVVYFINSTKKGKKSLKFICLWNNCLVSLHAIRFSFQRRYCLTLYINTLYAID